MSTEINIELPQESMSEEDQKLVRESMDALPKEEVEQKPEVTESKPDNDGDGEGENDDHLGAEHDDKTDEEREAIRERRRQERQNRKNFRKEKEDSYRREIDTLRKQLSEVNEWKNTVERRRVDSGVAQLDKSLKDSLDAIEVAKRAIKEATETQNGDALVDAQELYYAARRRAEGIHQVKQRMAQQMQRPPQQNIDPVIVKNAKSWMDGKDWYDPQGKDQDSRIALTVDNAMAEEGWNPRDSEYWDELDTRLKKYLPHRYNNRSGGHETVKPPTGGSGQNRGSGTSSNFVLSSERIRAMKDAGMWEDAEKRKAMIKRYIDQDRNS